jgi:Pyruvate/2-oxoacid:ferredoxin oxidoreductase delta subunit
MSLVQIEGQETYDKHQDLSPLKKLGLAGIALGFLFLIVNLTAIGRDVPALTFWLSIGLPVIGSLIYIFAQKKETLPGIKNDGITFNSLTSRGMWGWILGVALTGFYVALYWYPHLLENLIRMMDPLAYLIYGAPADQWFLYGTFYSLSVLVMGIRMMVYKYRHNRYHQVRTLSIIFFQLVLAYLIPYFLKSLNQPEFYFSYFWPLKIEYLFPNTFDWLVSHPGGLGIFMVGWAVIISLIGTPILTYFFGKRWYCSWVCGCGGLANTLGDPFRQLSDKSLKAWKIERWLIYSVLVFAIVNTILLWINSVTNGQIFGNASQTISQIYGFAIGAMFAGVIGVGFYPILGSRVWCRFGCPMAAILGILQKYFSRFRITTNGGQCISCGNCSTYCEMGIDVRWYAQREQNIIRASCVGCGVCAAVCPRGVLNLENGPLEGRYNLIEN